MSPRRRLRPVALLAAAAALLVAACSVERVRFTADDGDGGVDAAVDAPGGPLAILVSDTTLVVPEGQTRTVTVALSAPPPDAVLVTLELSDDTRLGATPTALLFGARGELLDKSLRVALLESAAIHQPVYNALDAVARDAGGGIDDRDAVACDHVEQAALADVGPADNGDARKWHEGGW